MRISLSPNYQQARDLHKTISELNGSMNMKPSLVNAKMELDRALKHKKSLSRSKEHQKHSSKPRLSSNNTDMRSIKDKSFKRNRTLKRPKPLNLKIHPEY